jgi:uncharacterized protein YjbJ (UPF0337 family)
MAGSGRELKGSVKEGLGKLTGNEKLKAKGRAEKVTGRTRRRAGGLADEVKGTMKQAAGKTTGNIDLEFEGKAQAAVGRVTSR